MVAFALVVAAMALIAAEPASASRKATEAERAAAAEAMGVPVECATVEVSEVDEAWASFYGDESEACGAGDTAVLRADVTGRFQYVTVAPTELDFCPLQGVPTPVAVDLDLCLRTTARTYVWEYVRQHLKVKPRTLPQGAHGAFQRLRWSTWNRSTAKARGVFIYDDAYENWKVPVRIRLYRPRLCETGVWLFTRRKLTAVRRRDRDRIRFESRRRAYGSCSAAQNWPLR